jgi:hypothetical protein
MTGRWHAIRLPAMSRQPTLARHLRAHNQSDLVSSDGGLGPDV